MKVVRARVLGFCMGVRRAVDLARAQAETCADVCTLGPLIHNPRALEELGRLGVRVMDESDIPENLNGVSVIIRAHGVSPQTEAGLRKRGANVIDATCPRVKASQLQAAAFAEAGYRIFLAGEKHHAEITGITGYATASDIEMSPVSGFYAAVGNAAEAEAAASRLHAENAGAKTALIGQTTITAEEYGAIGEVIVRFFPDIEIAQTICAATRERQDSLRELLDKVDAIVIAGGEESANTLRLLAIAETAGKPCTPVETAADIPPDFFSFHCIGLAAGASTPDTTIDAIERILKSDI